MKQNRHTPRTSPWNLVIQTAPHASAAGVFECLSDFGRVRRAEQENCFLLHAEDPVAALQHLRLLRRMNPAVDRAIERIVPLTETFSFASEDELAERVNRYIEHWRPRLAGKCVQVDHARDVAVQACADSATLGSILQDRLETAGVRDGEAPDLYIAFDCCGDWAGLSLLSRALCRRYPELGFVAPDASMA